MLALDLGSAGAGQNPSSQGTTGDGNGKQQKGIAG